MPGEEERGAFFDEPKPVLGTMEKGPKEEAGSKVEEYEKASQRLQIVKANETSIFLKKRTLLFLSFIPIFLLFSQNK